MTQKQKTHHLAVAAMLCAVAFVLQFIEFSIPLIPAFVKLDLSDLPALLGTFSLGPVYGVVIQLVKNLLHLPFGSSAGVGELSNFLLGSVFVLVAGLVYRRHKSPVQGPAGCGHLLPHLQAPVPPAAQITSVSPKRSPPFSQGTAFFSCAAAQAVV